MWYPGLFLLFWGGGGGEKGEGCSVHVLDGSKVITAFYLFRCRSWVLGTPGSLVIKSKLSPCSSSVVLRQFKLVDKRGHKFSIPQHIQNQMQLLSILIYTDCNRLVRLILNYYNVWHFFSLIWVFSNFSSTWELFEALLTYSLKNVRNLTVGILLISPSHNNSIGDRCFSGDSFRCIVSSALDTWNNKNLVAL